MFSGLLQNNRKIDRQELPNGKVEMTGGREQKRRKSR